MTPVYKSFKIESPVNSHFRAIKTKCQVTTAHDPALNQKPDAQIEAIGLWDTGATCTVITQKVVDALGLVAIGKEKVYHANGEAITDVYIVNLVLPNAVGTKYLRVTKGILSGFDVLIGMDLIAMGEFSITHVENKSVFEFKMPVDPALLKQSKPVALPKPSRNDPCPCNSGKKYKNCHGIGG